MIRHNPFLEKRIRLHPNKVLHIREHRSDDAIIVCEIVKLRASNFCHKWLGGARVVRLVM